MSEPSMSYGIKVCASVISVSTRTSLHRDLRAIQMRTAGQTAAQVSLAMATHLRAWLKRFATELTRIIKAELLLYLTVRGGR